MVHVGNQNTLSVPLISYQAAISVETDILNPFWQEIEKKSHILTHETFH